jgi:murein DD-endopeptidase MepM/ murein hydrolase activator NlpD
MSARGRFILVFVLLIGSVAALTWVLHRRQQRMAGVPQLVRSEPAPTSSPAQNQSPTTTPQPTLEPSPSEVVSPSPDQVTSPSPSPSLSPLASPPELKETASPSQAVPGFVGNLHLIIPVAGVSASQLRDTFDDARSEGRVHDAIDIPAAQGTPVMAVADGQIVKLFQSERGGTTIYQLSADRKLIYYYAHLQRYADGLTEGQSLRQGTVIAYVGDTGNAGTGNYHLHFSIAVVSDPKRYWEGININPYPLLRGGQ